MLEKNVSRCCSSAIFDPDRNRRHCRRHGLVSLGQLFFGSAAGTVYEDPPNPWLATGSIAAWARVTWPTLLRAALLTRTHPTSGRLRHQLHHGIGSLGLGWTRVTVSAWMWIRELFLSWGDIVLESCTMRECEQGVAFETLQRATTGASRNARCSRCQICRKATIPARAAGH